MRLLINALVFLGLILMLPVGPTVQAQPLFPSPTFNSITAGVMGFPQGGGSVWTAQDHADWNQLNTNVWNNPTEFQIYPYAPSGWAHCASPGVSGVVIRDTGSSFDASWAGRTAFYLVNLDNPAGVHGVASVQSANQLTMSNTCYGTASMSFFFTTTTNDGLVNVSGSTVTLVSGQPFALYPTAWLINGVAHTCTTTSHTTATCDTSGTQSSVTYHTDLNNFDELSLLRLQSGLAENSGTYGGANLAMVTRAIGEYNIIAESNGTNSSWPIFVMSGNYAPGNQYTQLGIYPTGTLTLGGRFGYDVVRIAPGAPGTGSNYFYASMAPSGYGPSWACRSNVGDVSVNCGFDTYGDGAMIFTSHSFGAKEFAIYGGGGVDFLTTYSSTGRVVLAADGASANADIDLLPKGAGTLSVNGSPGVSCPAGTVNLTTFVVLKGLVVHC